MRINKISITDFRNYQRTEVNFEKGLNTLFGKNGSGKTNIVEAIDYLTIGKSFRADSDLELIRFDSEFAKIEVEYFNKENCELKIIISKEGKKIYNNGIELKRLSELTGNVVDVLFVPKDALLFKDSPAVRRRLLDLTIASTDKRYLRELTTFKLLLKERNALLKNEFVDKTYLDVLTKKMIEPQFYIYKKRKELLDQINHLINKIYKEIDDEKNELKIDYQQFVKEEEFDNYYQSAINKYLESNKADMKRKATNEGIHHEDFKTYLNGHEIDLYGSQGQNRISCLALKLSLYEIIKEKNGDDPILILDDVLSELDENHQTKLINYLSNVEQTFITSAELNDELRKFNTFEIENNTVIRR